MTFIGSINADLRSIVSRYAQEWRGCSVYVGCSGNFTVERILAKAGVAELHGNDVSLYSCTVGRYLDGESFAPMVANEDWAWLTDYLAPGPPAIATLLLCTAMLGGYGRSEPYFVRMREAYRAQWDRLHAETVQRVEKALHGIHLDSFYAGDVVDFLTHAPPEAAFVSFPPTYAKGYERLYAAFDEVFRWDSPSYEVFDKARRLGVLAELMLQRERWLFARDEPVEQLQEYQVGRIQTAPRARPLYVYASAGQSVFTAPVQKIEQVSVARLEREEITQQSRLSVALLTLGQFNLLRSEYLDPAIAPSAGQFHLAALVDGRLIGAMAFYPSDSRRYADMNAAYLLSDFTIRPTRYPRLSKLVLTATLSTEVRQLAECALGVRINTITTTAFTDRPVSAKYRGLYTLDSRKPGRLQYSARAGQWSLQEGLAWWLKHHSSTTSIDD